jgi:predicted phosphodiesterase
VPDGYTVERTNEDVLTIRHKPIVEGWEQWYLLLSDVHFDSPHCDQKLLTKHLKQAQDRGAGVWCIGDWFDAMGGKNDKRASKSDTKKQDLEDNYFDQLVDHSAEYLEPFQENLVMLAYGNHDTSVLRHNETDILYRLCRQLKIEQMGYSGFIRLMFSGLTGRRSSRRYYWHHGAGGGGAVTKGAIGNQRRAAYVDADIYHSGHVHESMAQEHVRLRLNDSGSVVLATEWHIITPGYKQEYSLKRGFQMEKGNTPKPVGAYWLHFTYDGDCPGRVKMLPVKAA